MDIREYARAIFAQQASSRREKKRRKARREEGRKSVSQSIIRCKVCNVDALLVYTYIDMRGKAGAHITPDISMHAEASPDHN